MSQKHWILIPTALALTLFALFGLQLAGGIDLLPADVAAQTGPAAEPAALPRTITVVGEGSIAVEPDVATANVGVNVSAPTVEEATSEASSRMEKVMAALKAQGIADKDISTSNYSIHYEERPPEVARNTEGAAAEPQGVYRVNNMVAIKIRDLDKVGQVLDEAVRAGANSLWGVSFGLDDTSAVESDARAKAVEAARERAEELAQLNGVKVGQVIEISEVIGGGTYLPLRTVVAAEYGLGGGAGPISPGEMEVSVRIQVTYAIE